MEQKITQHTKKTEVMIEENNTFDTVGNALQQARIAQNLDVETVSNKLKIKSCYISALEQSDYTQFPALVYAVGFLKTYAHFLGLDASALVEKFKLETLHLVSPAMPVPVPDSQNVLPSKMILVGCFVLLLGLSSIWYMAMQPDKHADENVIEDQNVITSIPEVIEIAPVETDTILEQEIEPIVEKINTLDSSESSDFDVTEVVVGNKYGSLENKELVLVATEPVWMEVKEDGKVIFEKTLSKGDGYFVPNKSGLRMRTGNAYGLDVYLNGISKGKLSKTESVKKNILLEPSQFETY